MDKKEFLNLSLKATDNDPEAQYQMGLIFQQGKQQPQDDFKAFSWFNKAAKLGHIKAMNNLGICYLNGQGTDPNEEMGIMYLLEAAAKGSVDGQYNAGYYYHQKEEYQKAFKYFSMAASNNHGLSQYYLGYYYIEGLGCSKDYQKGFDFMQKAANQNVVDAQVNLALFYEEGEIIPLDEAKAFYYYKEAALNGDIESQNYVGVCYANGQYVKQDLEKAKFFLNEAASQGNEDAKENLKQLNKEINS